MGKILSLVFLFGVLWVAGCTQPLTAVKESSGASAHRAATDTNAALGAAVSTSYVSPWETLAALNDGFDPASSNDRSHAVYGNWDNPGTTQWVQYTFSQSTIISKSEVYWFADRAAGGGIDGPASCSLQYWNGTAWVNVASPVGLGVVLNQYNLTTFTPVATTRVRLNITAKTGYSSGIEEWKVWGTPETPPTGSYTFPPYVNIPGTTSGQTYLSNPALTVAGGYGGITQNFINGYLALSIGPSRPAQATNAVINTALTRINGDLKWLVETQGLRLPGFTNQYYIPYFLLGSGLSGDSTPTSNPPEAGYSGWVQAGGVWYPDVETTYHALAATDDYHRWALTHEFVHVVQNAYGTIDGNQIAWIHEAHNQYVTALLRQAKTGQATLGWLDPYTLMASYIPIESCGIVTSLAATGPGEYIRSDWLGNYGGYRYSALFPLFVAQRVHPHFFNTIWTQSTNRTSNESVLGTMVRLIGKTQVQQMMVEYGARNVLLDYGDFSADIKANLQSAWNASGGNFFYTAVSSSSGWYAPTNALLVPRHTGRNNIPITPAVGAAQVSVLFSPNAAGSKGSGSDLRAQLVYRALDGTIVAGAPVASGTASVTLSKTPGKGVVFLVVTNVKMDGYGSPANYGWDVSESFGYKFQITNGTPAPTATQYF